MRTNKNTLNDIGMIVMLVLVLVLDAVIFDAMQTVMDLPTWSLIMCIPVIMTSIIGFFFIKHFELADALKAWFGNIF